MIDYGLAEYSSPGLYGSPEISRLITYAFTVTDSSTGLPIQGAQCIMWELPNCGEGEGDGSLTDSQGSASVDVVYFTPSSWGVSKAGYAPICSNVLTPQIVVSLDPTTVVFAVNVLAGPGGSTTPSGFIQVDPNADLLVTAFPSAGFEFDYWVYKGQNVGSANPSIFLIDSDGITIAAVFKELVEPPPPPPNGDVWPVEKTERVFDNTRLAPGILSETQKQRQKLVDASLVLGGRIEYSVKLESSILTGCTYYIVWNDEVLESKGFFLWDPIGQIKTGIVDIPQSKIRNINVLTIALSHVPATNNVALFNVYVRLGYSSEPTEDPPWTPPPFNWNEFISKYGKWIAVGGGAILLITLMRPRGAPIIVIPGMGGKK